MKVHFDCSSCSAYLECTYKKPRTSRALQQNIHKKKSPKCFGPNRRAQSADTNPATPVLLYFTQTLLPFNSSPWPSPLAFPKFTSCFGKYILRPNQLECQMCRRLVTHLGWFLCFFFVEVPPRGEQKRLLIVSAELCLGFVLVPLFFTYV